MADNFTRKTIQETNVVPNLNFYELGDIILFKNGAVNFVTLVDGKKGLASIVTDNALSVKIAELDKKLADSVKKVSSLEKTIAGHETRIKALETPPTA